MRRRELKETSTRRVLREKTTIFRHAARGMLTGLSAASSLLVPGVTGAPSFFNGEPGNESNYPVEASQHHWFGWEHNVEKNLCCVECKMRVCCFTLGLTDPCSTLESKWRSCLNAR
jgi:hypothetical protein